MKTAADITPESRVLYIGRSARSCRETNAAADCGEVPVVDTDGQLIGVMTARDIVCRVLAAGKNPGPCEGETWSPRNVQRLWMPYLLGGDGWSVWLMSYAIFQAPPTCLK